jgi:hypothetical protein
MSIVLLGSTSGSITLQEPAVAGTTTIDLPASSGTMVVTGGAQTIEFADGTVSAPSITNSGDTNTGMFFPAADTIAFAEGGSESMRIDSSGNLLVGKTSADNTTAGNRITGTYISSAGTSDFYLAYSTTSSAYRFYVTQAGTVTATNTTISAISDQRFKENIVDLDVGLNAVMALKPRKFDWKVGKGKDIKGDRGFIAQEFEQIFPDLIDKWKDPAPEGEEPYKAVRQDLIPVLVKAIQELKAELDATKAEVQALKGTP